MLRTLLPQGFVLLAGVVVVGVTHFFFFLECSLLSVFSYGGQIGVLVGLYFSVALMSCGIFFFFLSVFFFCILN